MDTSPNVDNTDVEMPSEDFQDARDDEISAELQETQHLSAYDSGYDSQAVIGETENTELSGVNDIVCIEDMVFAVDIRRVAVRVFRRNSTDVILCDIDVCEEQQLIVSIAYNVNDDSLLVLKEDKTAKTSELLSFKIESIRIGNPYTESKHIDNCLDFDVPSNRAMSYDQIKLVFIIHDLINYEPKFELEDTTSEIEDFRFQSYQKNSYAMMFNKKYRNKFTISECKGFLPSSVVPAIFYSKEDGKAKHDKAVELPLKRTRIPLKYLQLLGEKVLLSQWGEGGFLILDVSSDGIKTFPANIIRTTIESDIEPRYLSKTNEFFTFKFWGTVQIYNLDGDLIRNLDDHRVNVNQNSTDPTQVFKSLSYVTSDEEIIISYCQSAVGFSINVSSLRTGKCLGKIANEKLDSEVITILTYDEKTHEIFTGNSAGFVCKWYNRFINPSHSSSNPQMID